ncbi:transcription-repair-coupling factor [bacterium BMS3Abin07]|nr:transcription-repair-coupling factor [bacterium BMS3Abin07]HDO22905.1 transcription-repair coupling factor [Nitrospirota bacterium]HDZ89007.1 transcription-repair coupling factor [Nitrospirota bacterium]
MNLKEKLRNNLGMIADAGGDTITGFRGSGIAAMCAFLDVPLLVSAEDEYHAEVLKNDILFYLQFFRNCSVELLPYPSDTYQSGLRARTLYNLPDIRKVVSYPRALLGNAGSGEGIAGDILLLKCGGTIERDMLVNGFRRLGYCQVPMVAQRGDLSVRNWIIDIFPSTAEYPVRIEFFGDEIESLRYFRIDTQRSVENIPEVIIYPAVDTSGDEGDSLLLERIKGNRLCLDVEGGLRGKGLDGDITTLTFVADGINSGIFRSLEGKGILFNDRSSVEDIPSALKDMSEDIVIVLPNYYQAKRISELFEQHEMFVPVVDPEEIDNHKGRIVITLGNLSRGIYTGGLLLLSQKELFGKDAVLSGRLDHGGEKFLENIEDIARGDFVVHEEHGIGKFKEMSRYRAEGTDIDVAVVEYADSSTLYVPLYNIRKIEKYRGGEGVIPALDRIGGKTWERKKKRVRKRIDAMVGRLLELYAGREVCRGFAFSADTEMHREFYSFFSYEETRDQIKAVNEISSDMESASVMERLLCGDVGFGKTEIAMRAAFKAVFDGKQVAVIVPTTILCEQHCRNFTERFSAFPVVIDYISRFKSLKHIKKTIERIRRGGIDIIIATHALFRRNVEFNNLGLLIIDEEHRFGVADKEKIKEIKKGVDCLMLSATPIPRTLQMTLSGIRAMSNIESPPEERLSVRTSVSRFDGNLIRGAVNYEVSRGGQVFFVHNRIADIDKMQAFLEKLLPGIRIRAAHGRMKSRELEDIMVAFMNHDYDLLLCTNIIGSGIDIPGANTIFINLADRFGLADLYQLKGRVGRGNIKAFAYFLVDKEKMLTDEGRRRLKAIERLSYLGAGLKLAMKDLEIRGAGTLFGYKQSGYINELGFDMYMDLLKKEIGRLKGETEKEDIDPEIVINIDARIPESYVGDDVMRLSLYRRLSLAGSDEELADFSNEVSDRFGRLPEDMRRLLSVVSLRIMAKKLGVKKLSLDKKRVSVSFVSNNGISVERFLGLAERYKGLRYNHEGFEMAIVDVEDPEALKKISDMFRYLSGRGVN